VNALSSDYGIQRLVMWRRFLRLHWLLGDVEMHEGGHLDKGA